MRFYERVVWLVLGAVRPTWRGSRPTGSRVLPRRLSSNAPRRPAGPRRTSTTGRQPGRADASGWGRPPPAFRAHLRRACRPRMVLENCRASWARVVSIQSGGRTSRRSLLGSPGRAGWQRTGPCRRAERPGQVQRSAEAECGVSRRPAISKISRGDVGGRRPPRKAHCERSAGRRHCAVGRRSAAAASKNMGIGAERQR